MSLAGGGLDTAAPAPAPAAGNKVTSVETPDGRTWIKLADRDPSRAWHLLHAAVARLLGLRLFRPPVYRSAHERIAGEARRLTALKAHGLPVPALIAVAPGRIVMSDNGVSLHGILPGLDHEARLALIDRALDFVLQLHGDGHWHGACQIRNITERRDGDLGMIDFEDDMEGAMPPPARQARDLVQFMMSAARHLDRDRTAAVTGLLRRAFAASRPETRAELALLARRTRIFRPLARWIGPRLGRDGRDLAVLVLALAKAGNEGKS
jgi:tRNA A-37 threonylcarbamoyl transferase component Bud32